MHRKYILQFPWWRTRTEITQILALYMAPGLMPVVPTNYPQKLDVWWKEEDLRIVQLALKSKEKKPFSITPAK